MAKTGSQDNYFIGKLYPILEPTQGVIENDAMDMRERPMHCYKRVLTLDSFRALVKLLAHEQLVHAIDFETTSLDPRDGFPRLAAISGPRGNYVVDLFSLGKGRHWAFWALAQIANACPWAVYNAKFEGRWFDHAIAAFSAEKTSELTLYDIGLMHVAVQGGGPTSLAWLVKRYLDKERSKELQLSDWSAQELTDAQWSYAAEDGVDTYSIYRILQAKMTDGQWNGFEVINDSWRGTIECEQTGIVLDPVYHRKLIRMWTLRREVAEKCIRRFTTEEVLPNIRSKHKLSEIICSVLDDASIASWPKTDGSDKRVAAGKSPLLRLERKNLTQASFRAPYPFSRWLAALIVFNRADKYLSTYGNNLLTVQEQRGAITARFNIAAAVTGRYSSSGPNLQNIPRAKIVRQSFIALPHELLVLADYSGIELRVLAEMSGDEQLKQDVIFGNVHAENAVQLYQQDRDEFFQRLADKDPRAKEMRSRAKAFSFQLTYGAGRGALAVVMRCSDDEAQDYVNRWAQRYPRAFAFRTYMFEKMQDTGFLTCASGRTIYVPRAERSIPVASNWPIQGSAADVMYRAVARVQDENQRLMGTYAAHASTEDLAIMDAFGKPRVRLAATVHDELIQRADFALACGRVEPSNISDADYDRYQNRLSQWAHVVSLVMKEQMEQAWLDVFPGTSVHALVDPSVGLSWADKE